VALLLVLGGGGFAGWKFFLAKKTTYSDAEAAKVEEEKNTAPGIMHEMEPFIVNLLDQDGKRYLKTQFEIEVETAEVQEELKKRTPQIRDTILLLLTSKSFSEIGIPGGKVKLRTELIERINGVLKNGTIRTLYFTEFVVQ
jgi:flagellar FliL protein